MLCSLMQMVSLRHAYSRLQSCRRCYTQSAVECQRIEQDVVAQFSHVNARSSVTVTHVNGDVVLHAPNIEEEDLNITELNAPKRLYSAQRSYCQSVAYSNIY